MRLALRAEADGAVEEPLRSGHESLGVYLVGVPGLEGDVQRAEQLHGGELGIVDVERARRDPVYDQPLEAAYFIRPTVSPLRHLRKLGLALVDPEGATDNIASLDYEFETVSFELADKYPVDFILLDDGTGFMSRDELAAIPTWQAQPAVQTGQVVSFRGGGSVSYRHYTEFIERTTDAVQRADPNIV